MFTPCVLNMVKIILVPSLTIAEALKPIKQYMHAEMGMKMNGEIEWRSGTVLQLYRNTFMIKPNPYQ